MADSSEASNAGVHNEPEEKTAPKIRNRASSPAQTAAAKSQAKKTASNGEAKKDEAKPAEAWPERISNGVKNIPQNLCNFPGAFVTLFFPNQQRFMPHRLLGLIFLIQYAISVYLFLTDYNRWIKSPFVWTVPLNGLLQSINAAFTFTFLPRKEEPGFTAVADNSPLSYFTVVENSFYAMQAFFASCYLHDSIKPLIQRFIVVEPFFVFFVFYARNLWPVSSFTAAHNNPKHRSEKNKLTLTISTYAIKGFYIYAKHFVGFFPLYLRFLDRITPEEQHLLYAVQVLSSYAATISIFIHTLKFKGYIGPITGMVLYDVIIPGFVFLYFRMLAVILRNADVALVTLIGLVVNLSPKTTRASEHPDWKSKFLRNWPFHAWQACVAALCYSGYLQTGAK